MNEDLIRTCRVIGSPIDQQIAGLEMQFVEGGGYSEQLAAAWIEKRRKDLSGPGGREEKEKPACPLCKGLMVLRTAKKGAQAGNQFWGCSAYPSARGL